MSQSEARWIHLHRNRVLFRRDRSRRRRERQPGRGCRGVPVFRNKRLLGEGHRLRRRTRGPPEAENVRVLGE